MRRMIFHCPVKNEGNPDASQLRPLKMIEAFRQIGYDVAVVYGDGAERKKSIAAIKRSIRGGVKYDFCIASHPLCRHCVRKSIICLLILFWIFPFSHFAAGMEYASDCSTAISIGASASAMIVGR